MKISKNWFVRFEPNFQSSQKTILYKKLNGDLYELSEVYFDFINNINQKSTLYKLKFENVRKITLYIADVLLHLSRCRGPPLLLRFQQFENEGGQIYGKAIPYTEF